MALHWPAGQEYDCATVWQHTSVLDTGEQAPAAMMQAVTRHPKSLCLEQDDLDGLNTLYPTCQVYAFSHSEQ